MSFDDLAISVSNNDLDFGVMAIENSIAGSIIPNYALIDTLNLNIVGEYYININHQLMVFPGINMEDLKFVSSHPMALLQCKNFLMKYPHITLVEEKDTADVAKQISEKKIKNTAAIASIEAAEFFGLEIISSNIQTIKNNETRFVIVSKELSKNENLIDTLNLNIVGEYFININHQLMVFPGTKIEDLKFVSSHPMALLQCKKFLRRYPHITLVEEKDTADVAKQISENKIKDTAAIASFEAAKIFGLEIISSNIQTIKNNETRFVIVSKELSKNENLIDKASLKFSLSHETGSLASVLSILKDYNLNLTKIQSLPIVEIHWKYSFFVDTTFSSIENFNDAIDLIKNEAESLKVLGLYKNQMK